MDVIKLNSNFEATTVIENYETMIWTERYLGYGEFKLTTNHIEPTMNLLPMDTYISLQDSGLVMIVENHIIEPDEERGHKLSITGRTVDSVLERRFLVSGYYGTNDTQAQGMPFYPPLGTPADQAAFIINNILPFSMVDHELGMFDAEVHPSADVGDERGDRPIINDYLDQVVQLLLREEKCAIKSNRFDSSVSLGKVRLTIYKGVNRSIINGNGYVALTLENSEFNRLSYLKSHKGIKNVGIYNHNNPDWGAIDEIDAANNMPPTVSGLSRREYYADVNPFYNVGQLNWTAEARLVALTMLKQFKGSYFITAELGVSAYKYGTDYNLGDTVFFKGDYGIMGDLIVSEYTRIEDKEGDRSFTSLVEEL